MKLSTKKGDVVRCSYCHKTKNPRFAVVDLKTGEVMSEVCKNCMSNLDKALQAFHENITNSTEIYRFHPEDEIPF